MGHEVHLILLPIRPGTDIDSVGHLNEFGASRFFYLVPDMIYKALYLPKRLYGNAKRCFWRILGDERQFYHGLDEFFPETFRKRLSHLNQVHQFDAVMVEYVFQSAAFDAFPDHIVKVLDTHDSFSDRHRVVGSAKSLFSVPASEQTRGFRRANVILAIQDDEAHLFRRQLEGAAQKVVVVSHLVDVSSPVIDYSPSDAVFIGSGNEANVQAVDYFSENVLPLIRDELPDFELKVAGSVCRRIAYREGVRKVGVLKDVVDAFSFGAISLNPVLNGTGIAIKLLDAMACGVVTVATSTGARGLPDAYCNGVVIVDDFDNEAMAKAVIELVRDQDLRTAKGQAAYKDAVNWNSQQLQNLASVFAVEDRNEQPRLQDAKRRR
ncbi:hypothetical protein ASD74_02230 [Rhizobium sp. Root564]|nr:hypothetical protein ASE62_17090 [Rhizobium sp. Leaf202]KQN81710.1 hypothetical protein ASF03_18830 [Rhizobium sp. Leaf68]KRA05336.1 hypothetical protein ASD74_02230 [Rhizobium sp. Root564]